MNKDRVKTFILISLVLSSLFLSSKIWFSEKLWSNDYNFFIKWKDQKWVQEALNKLPIFSEDESNASAIKDYLFSPLKVVVNLGEYGTVFYEESEEYENFNSLYKNVFEFFLKGSQDLRRTVVDNAEWLAVLGSRDAHFFVDYGISCDTKTIGQIMGVKDSPVASSISRFKEIIIVPGDSVSNDIVIYLKSYKDGVVNKYVFNYNKTELLSFLSSFDSVTVPKYIFSFEKDLDKKKNNRIIIDSQVLIPINKINLPMLKSHSTFKPDNYQYMGNILNTFGYSANTLRRYTEQDNTLVYVENDSTLKIHPDGIIEYKAIEKGKGLKLFSKQLVGEKNTFSLYESLTMVTDIMKKTGAVNKNLHITSDILASSDKPGVYKFTFDYFSNGIPVLVKLENDIYTHAIEVEIADGTLNYYKEYLRNYDDKQSVRIDVTVLQAVDLFLSEHGSGTEKEIKINNVYLNYIDDTSKTLKKPYWNISVEGEKRAYSITAVISQ